MLALRHSYDTKLYQGGQIDLRSSSHMSHPATQPMPFAKLTLLPHIKASLRHAQALFGILVTVLVLGIFLSINHIENERFRIHERALLLEKLTAARAMVESMVSSHLGALDALEGLIHTQPTLSQEAFRKMVDVLRRNRPAIRQIELAPRAIIRYIHPLGGNENALGLDLRALPGQREMVETTIRSGVLKIAGPLELHQGGLALIARQPIFLGQQDASHFWGFAIIIFDFPRFTRIMNESGAFEGLHYAIRGVNGLGGQGDTFIGHSELFEKDPIVLNISIPNGNWQIAAEPKEGWLMRRPGEWQFLTFAVFVALLLGSMTALLVRRGISMQRLAAEDFLTHLDNRRCFEKKAHTECSRAKRTAIPLALVLLDIDFFKKINDQYGHAGGDRVLTALATSLREHVPAHTVIGRLGGEEFAILLPNHTIGEACVLSNTLRETLENTPVTYQGHDIHYTASFGIAEWQQGDDYDQLIQKADHALYQSKREGRNRCSLANPY